MQVKNEFLLNEIEICSDCGKVMYFKATYPMSLVLDQPETTIKILGLCKKCKKGGVR